MAQANILAKEVSTAIDGVSGNYGLLTSYILGKKPEYLQQIENRYESALSNVVLLDGLLKQDNAIIKTNTLTKQIDFSRKILIELSEMIEKNDIQAIAAKKEELEKNDGYIEDSVNDIIDAELILQKDEKVKLQQQVTRVRNDVIVQKTGSVDVCVQEISNEIGKMVDEMNVVREMNENILKIAKQFHINSQEVSAAVEEQSATMQEIASSAAVLTETAVEHQVMTQRFKL